jgi:hypothetical protein
MGGPSASILLRERLTRAERDQIHSAVRAVSSDVHANQVYACDFWVNDMRPLGGSYVGNGRPFGLGFHEPDENPGLILDWEPEELDRLVAEIGFMPQQKVGYMAFCNGREDHVILAHLTLHVAELTGGMIDFNGALHPPLPARITDEWLWWEKTPWSDVEHYFTAMVGAMPGRIVSVIDPAQVGEARHWPGHVADATFLRAWLAHPDFHMIK